MGVPEQFGGEEHFRAPPERLYALLVNLDAMTRTIPDLVSSQRVDEHTVRCVVRPGFSFLRGTLKLVIALADLQPPQRASMNISAQGIGVTMRIASDLQIEAAQEGSKLAWRARFEEIKGLAAALSPGLLKAAADQVVRHAWSAVRKELGE